MRISLLICSILVFIGSIFAQEGIAYRNAAYFIEKSYDVNQKFGKNKMRLMTISTGSYDSLGNHVLINKTKGNLNYEGKTVVLRDSEPNTWEIRNYNYMGNLIDRWVKITEADPREYTEIQYSSKGKIVSKSSVRIDSLKMHQWDFVYNELGYVPSYFEVETDTSGLVTKKIKYDYGDNPVETTLFLYNEQKSLLSAIVYDVDNKVTSKTIYVYDERNNLIKLTGYDKQGHEDYIEEWSYDDLGRMMIYNYYIFDARFGGIPKLRKTKTYEYIDRLSIR